MDTLVIATVLGAIIGQLCHIVKKRTEGDGNEIDTFKRWVLQRPFNTAISLIAAVGGAFVAQADPSAFLAFDGAVDPSTILVRTFLQAAITGFAADSMLNRPGIAPPQ